MQRCTGTEVSQILCKIASGVVAVYFQNDIARVEAGVLGSARWLHIDHGGRLIECEGRLKSRVTNCDLGSKYLQTHAAEESVPGKLLYTADIFLKELAKVGLRKSFNALTNALRVIKKFFLLCIMLV